MPWHEGGQGQQKSISLRVDDNMNCVIMLLLR